MSTFEKYIRGLPLTKAEALYARMMAAEGRRLLRKRYG